MIDVEPMIARELGQLVPEPAGVRADWSDVVGRAGLLPWRRRRLVLAFAVLAAVFVTAAAVATTLGGFDKWLSGTPGKPASSEAQQRFEAANGHSWASFPKTTKLRELIRAETDGREYVLYGFRSGDSLCLQLAVSELTRQLRECAPTSAIANASLPIVVFNDQWGFSDRAQRPIAQVSFGVVADGVSRVGVHAVDGFHTADLGGNAYLYVGSRPNTGNRILAISALDVSRRLRVVPIEFSRSPLLSSDRVAGGPMKLQARIANPRVGWLERGEKVGFAGYARPGKRPGYAGATSFRFLKPDPLSNLAVGVSNDPLCIIAVEASGDVGAQGCGTFEGQRQGPIMAMLSCNSCGGFMEVRGVAADGIRRIVIFLAEGSSQAVPLRHNLFAARVAYDLPMRIVGYDASSRVVAIWTWAVRRPPVPAAAKRLRVVAEARGPHGATAQLLVGPNVRGYECWRATFSTGQVRGTCVQPSSPGAQTYVDLVQPAGRDLFFVGTVGRRTHRIEFRFAGDDVLSVQPVASHFVAAVPRDHLSSTQQRAFMTAFDGEGRRTIRQRVFFRLP